MKQRILSLLLCAVLILGCIPVMPTVSHAATVSQNNIVNRADYLYNITWICQKTVSGWRGNYTYYKGSTYRLPYGQPINSGYYIGFGVNVDTFISATKDASSVFYTAQSTYGSTYSVYYATDCSAFVSWCWGTARKTTYSIPQISTYIGMATAANASKLQLGDALNSNDVGHVVLVTDLVYDSNGNLTQIEITEQTPPQLKRSYYTPAGLGAEYGTYYGIYRYTGTVPAAPAVSSVTTKYYPACDASYTTFYAAMDSIGVSCDWTLHCRIAEINGITDFTGTPEQNTSLLNLLKEGKLLNPDYVEVSYYPACDSSYTTFYAAMESIGVSCDWDLHCRIAAANGITDFTGTAEQNTQLLNLLKAGKLINPDGTASGDSGTTGGSGVSGYDNGYAGGMPGDGVIYAHGLDVSYWQGEDLDFNMIKNAGYDYVILRAGSTKGKDTCFETYYKNAKAAGLDVGAYYYSYATTVSGAKTDADNMIAWVSGKKFEYPLYFDYEDSSQDNLSTTTAKNICLTFMDALAEEGYLVGMYTGYYKSTQLPMSEICKKYEFWVANYWDYTYQTLSPSYSTQYGMYQYTDRNYIGSYGPYDGDVAFKDYPSIVKKYGFNGYSAEVTASYLDQCTYYPSHGVIRTTKETPVNTLPCSASGSHGSQTLETAAADTTFTVIGLYKNTSGNYWYQAQRDDGSIVYIYGGHAEFKEQLITDIILQDYTVPNAHVAGSTFDVTGTIRAEYVKLDSAYVCVHRDYGLAGELATVASDTVTDNSYTLQGSTIDSGISMSGLETGKYTYAIFVNYTNYYAAAAKELGTKTGVKYLCAEYFNVIDAAVDPAECTHDYDMTVLLEPGCTTEGMGIRSCTICGEVTRSFLPPAHSYVDGGCTVCGGVDADYTEPVAVPTLTGSGFSLSFEDEILVNFYYTVSDSTDVAEQGILVFYAEPAAVDTAQADEVYTGFVSRNGLCMNTTTGIAAKKMGDTRYYAAYAKLIDGTYVYSPVYQYSPKKYASNMLGRDTTTQKQKNLCVAMLNYGAAAQKYFGYKTDDLMNAFLTTDQRDMVIPYTAGLFTGAVSADASKTGAFTRTASGFSSRSASVSFEGAFAINYYFAPDAAVAGEMTLYYWTPGDYALAATLTVDNASGSFVMQQSADGAYWGQVSGIAAKLLDETYYVAGVYTDGEGNTCCTGVIPYSLSRYCLNNAKDGNAMQELASMTAMYGYYAKIYFAS